MIGQDDIEAFGEGVVVQLAKLTSWGPTISVANLPIEGHASAGKIRESLSLHVSIDLGPTPKPDDLTEMVRRRQGRDTEWRHQKRSEFPGKNRA